MIELEKKEALGTAEYFSFALGEEVFALEITKVREVLDYSSIFKIPRMPDFIRGVINLRGDVVPVVDLRLKLGMSATERTVNTCIVIVEIGAEGETVLMGILVDGVQEVFTLDLGQVKPPPKIGTHLNTEFIRGIGKRGEEFLVLLDLNRVFSNEEIDLVQQSADEAGPLEG